MAQQGEQIEAEQHGREGLLAMPNVVLPMVALGREHLGVCLGDLPPPPACVCHGRDVFCSDAVRGDPTLVGELGARFGVDDRARAPMDRYGRLPVEEEPLMARALQRHGGDAAMPRSAFTGGETGVRVPKGPTLLQLGMGLRLAPQEAGEALCQGTGTPGLLARPLIAQAGPLRRGKRLGMFLAPACAGHLRAVLFVLALGRQDGRGR